MGWHSWDALGGEAGDILHEAEAHHKAMGTKKAWPRLIVPSVNRRREAQERCTGMDSWTEGPSAAAERGPAADPSQEPLPHGTRGRDIPDGHVPQCERQKSGHFPRLMEQLCDHSPGKRSSQNTESKNLEVKKVRGWNFCPLAHIE